MNADRTPFVLPPYPYDRLDGLRHLAQRHPGGLVNLSIGTPVDQPPAAAVEALARSGAERGYPPSIGTAALREAAAEWIARRFGVSVDPGAEVAATVGSKEFITGLPHWLRLRAGAGRDTVLYPELSYPSYAMGAQLAGCRAVSVPLDERWSLRLDAIREADAQRALMLWVNTPGNPAGGLDDLAAVAAWGRAHDVPVFSDECYAEFTWHGEPRTILSPSHPSHPAHPSRSSGSPEAEPSGEAVAATARERREPERETAGASAGKLVTPQICSAGAEAESSRRAAKLSERAGGDAAGAGPAADDTVYGSQQPTTTGQAVRADCVGVVAVHSLSKRSNLAGIRVGFCAGDPELMHFLREIRKHAGLMAPGPVQSAAVAALADQAHVDVQQTRYRDRLMRLSAVLRRCGTDSALPAGGCYLWAPAPDGDAWAFARTLLTEVGVLVSPGEFYGAAGSAWVRVAAMISEADLELVESRLR